MSLVQGSRQPGGPDWHQEPDGLWYPPPNGNKAQTAPPDNGVRRCPGGHTVAAEAHFCPDCGASIAAQAPSDPWTEEEAVAPEGQRSDAEQATRSPESPDSEIPTASNAPPSSAPSNRMFMRWGAKKWLGVAALIVLVLAGTAVGLTLNQQASNRAAATRAAAQRDQAAKSACETTWGRGDCTRTAQGQWQRSKADMAAETKCESQWPYCVSDGSDQWGPDAVKNVINGSFLVETIFDSTETSTGAACPETLYTQYTQVLLEDGAGKQIGTTQLNDGKVIGFDSKTGGAVCDFAFVISEVPYSSIYQVDIKPGNALSVTLSTLESDGMAYMECLGAANCPPDGITTPTGASST